MLNFAVGPVPSNDQVRAIGSQDIPYFRTKEFSEIMLQNERMLCGLAHAPKDSRVCFISGSGTAGMEAAVMGTLDRQDRALVVDGGSFGHRFVEMLSRHHIPHDVIKLVYGTALCEGDLLPYEDKGYTAFLINLGETSQGILYDAELIGSFCARNGLFLIVDTISSFLADPFDMEAIGADVMITGSQKALACPPGVAPIILSPVAMERISRIEQPCMYLDLRLALENGKRGQTPFTPAVGTLLQIYARLQAIEDSGGAAAEVSRVARIAQNFRDLIVDLPLDQRLTSPSNAVTYLSTRDCSARKIFEVLKDEYEIWVCPNGGASAEKSFRVGHIGEHDFADNALLVAALRDVCRRGLMG